MVVYIVYECADCGYKFIVRSNALADKHICPECGGERLLVLEQLE